MGKGNAILLFLLLVISAVVIGPAESSNVPRTEQADMPTWNVGDMWNYSFWMHEEGTDEYGNNYYIDYTGIINASITSSSTIIVNENNYNVYVAKINYDITGSGTYGGYTMSIVSSINGTYYYRVSDLAIVKELSNTTMTYTIDTTPSTVSTYSNSTVTTYAPPKDSNKFPITVGESWPVNVIAHMSWYTVTNDVPENGACDKSVNETYECLRTDSVCVAAGTYDVFVINSTTESGNETSYYSPDVRNFVKSEFYNETGVLTSEMNLVSYSVSLPLVGSISGRVTTDSTPLNNTIVTAYYACNSSPAGNDTTDENGDYVILNLPEGAYNVTATMEGYQSNTTTNIDVTAGHETQNINFTLSLIPSTTGTITGHVYISGTTTGIHNANVSVNASYALTDVNGAYTLLGVTPGTHTVTATAADYAPLSAVVNVTAGQTSFCNFTLTLLSETGNITGTVTADGNALDNATVTVEGIGSTAQTNSTGHYIITGVPAGTYNVTASKTGYVSSTLNVNVTAKNTTELNFVLIASAEQQRGSISGTVMDKNGVPLAFATVTAYYANNNTIAKTTTTNSTGGYTLSDLLPATYTIKISKTGFKEYSMNVTLGANQTLTSKDAALTSETGGEGGEGGGGAEGADLSGYLWIAVVIAVIIVVVLVVLKRRIPIGRRMPVREEMPPAREEILPEKPVLGKRFCIKCGSEISKTAGFCPYCGYRFKK